MDGTQEMEDTQTTGSFVLPGRREIETLVHAATMAPSADNNQPWQFVVLPDRLQLFHDESAAIESDPKHTLNYLALGMAIENLRIAASQYGFQLTIDYCPDPHVACHIADIRFRLVGPTDEPKYTHIFTRHTNRMSYDWKRALPEGFLTDLAALQRQHPQAIVVTDDRQEIRNLSSVVWQCDKIRLSYRSFCDEMVKSLQTSKKRFLEERVGILVDDLMLPPPVRPALRLFKHWPAMRLLVGLRLIGLVVLGSKIQILKSRSIGLICAPDNRPESCVRTGELFAAVWLSATEHGVALHPTCSYPVIEQLAMDEDSDLSLRHRTTLQQQKTLLEATLPSIRGRTPLVIFRLGVAKPIARSPVRIPAVEKIDWTAGGQQD